MKNTTNILSDEIVSFTFETVDVRDTKTYSRDFYHTLCGHYATESITVARKAYDAIEAFYDKDKEQYDFCPKCQVTNKQYHMIKTVIPDSSYGDDVIVYLFETNNVREIVRYCYANHMSIHTHYFPTYSPYDCTGKLIERRVEITKGKKYFTMMITQNYDV